ncbi:MAG: hypothetical protein R2865_01385 [Deinococcales bacterium]
MSGKNVGSKEAFDECRHRSPPGAIAYAHIHDGFEVMLFILRGTSAPRFWSELCHSVENEAGDFIYIEPGGLSAGSLISVKGPLSL